MFGLETIEGQNILQKIVKLNKTIGIFA